MKRFSRLSGTLILLAILASASLPAVLPDSPASGQELRRAERYRRTELYFGLGRKNGGAVSEAEWAAFLEEEVTPRFPDGLTAIAASGQFRGAAGIIVKEPSRVLILLYPKRERKKANAKIEEIRTAYLKRFEQESVLRLDFPASVKVSF